MWHRYSSCHCLPDRICGTDTDSLFAYETPKIVRIQDRSLGLLKLTLMLLIVIYVFVICLWKQGQHFKETSVEGIARLQWQEPVKRCNPKDQDCNADFTSKTQLPYCSQYIGNNASTVSMPCKFYDGRELPIVLRGGVLLPSRRDVFRQVKDCSDTDDDCRRKFKFVNADGGAQMGTGDAIPVSAQLVADVEDFTMLIDHSFRTANGMMTCDDKFMDGFWKKCDMYGENCVTEPLKCVHKDCANIGKTACGVRTKDPIDIAIEAAASSMSSKLLSTGRLRNRSHTKASRASRQATLLSTDESGGNALTQSEEVAMMKQDGDLAISISLGDVFSLKTLLAMAGKSLEDPLSASSTGYLRTVRSRGTAIEVLITYENWVPWTLWKTKDPPTYTISATSRPVEEYKHQWISDKTADSRILHVDYGTFIILTQTGNLLFPNVMNTIVTFAGAMVLLSVANLLTDMLAMKLLPRSDIYKDLKYQESEDLVPDLHANKEEIMS